jgi:hypothetical protein
MKNPIRVRRLFGNPNGNEPAQQANVTPETALGHQQKFWYFRPRLMRKTESLATALLMARETNNDHSGNSNFFPA